MMKPCACRDSSHDSYHFMVPFIGVRAHRLLAEPLCHRLGLERQSWNHRYRLMGYIHDFNSLAIGYIYDFNFLAMVYIYGRNFAMMLHKISTVRSKRPWCCATRIYRIQSFRFWAFCKCLTTDQISAISDETALKWSRNLVRLTTGGGGVKVHYSSQILTRQTCLLFTRYHFNRSHNIQKISVC